MKEKMSFLAIVGAALLLAPYSALAVTIGFSPVSQTVGLQDLVSVDIVVSDLGDEIVSAYDLDVTYDSSILSATSVTFGPWLGDESAWEALNSSDTSVPGLVDLAQVSLLWDDDLSALQPDSFTLATLAFEAIGFGTSPLDFTFDAFNDIKGLNAAVLAVQAGSGSVNVIPEPRAALVFAIGLLLIGAGIAKQKLPARAS